LLTSCLALVRPVGLSDENARDWLLVAAGEVGFIHADLLEEACAAARRACTHHGQIVPAIIKHAAERMDARNRLEAQRQQTEREEQWRKERAALPKPDEWHPTIAELDELRRRATSDLSV